MIHIKNLSFSKRIITQQRLRLGLIIFAASIVIGLLVLLVTKRAETAAIASGIILVLSSSFFIIRAKLHETEEIKKMEAAFPDFLELMASNLRAGMTIDRALLLSSREEFAPLDKEILQLVKDLVTEKEIDRALNDMALRVHSEKIKKTLALLITGIRSGGNVATLLQDTATNLRERGFVEKRAASNVLMYVIFIFFAVAVGAPLLFGLSSVLVETLTHILESIPPIEANVKVPFALSQINISVTFITYFALIFMIVTDVLGSLVLGAVSKGD